MHVESRSNEDGQECQAWCSGESHGDRYTASILQCVQTFTDVEFGSIFRCIHRWRASTDTGGLVQDHQFPAIRSDAEVIDTSETSTECRTNTKELESIGE